MKIDLDKEYKTVYIQKYDMLEPIEVLIIDNLINEYNEEYILYYRIGSGYFDVVSKNYILDDEEVLKIRDIALAKLQIKELEQKIKALEGKS